MFYSVAKTHIQLLYLKNEKPTESEWGREIERETDENKYINKIKCVPYK